MMGGRRKPSHGGRRNGAPAGTKPVPDEGFQISIAGCEVGVLGSIEAAERFADQAGRHAEIKRRYGRGQTMEGNRIKSIRRAQVVRLLQDRHGGTVPADASGEAALQLLFELGADGPTAQRLAPWADGADIERLIAAADGNWRAWPTRRRGEQKKDPKLVPERIGERLEISFDEYKRLHLTHLRPGDADRHEVDQYLADRKTERERERMRRCREQAKQKPDASDPWNLPEGRAKALACGPLADREWWTVRKLAEYARGCLAGYPGCLGAFDGLDHAAARKAMLRAVRELKKLGIIETRTEAGPRGLKVLHVRRPMTPAEIEAERQQLLDEVAAEQNAEIIEDVT